MQVLAVRTRAKEEMREITVQVQDFVTGSGLKNGACVVYVPHTTAGITINENADPDVVSDILMELGKVIPERDNYRHLEGNSAAHIKASLMGSSVTVPVKDGKLMLGTWQGIYFCEFDGPRERKVYVTALQQA
ncbi:MAG: YjbQ family protein [Thermoanaerobacteraceae bacterium]|nr:YjbQ family protein [Thermoanaerobacteraceae bacterium]